MCAFVILLSPCLLVSKMVKPIGSIPSSPGDSERFHVNQKASDSWKTQRRPSGAELQPQDCRVVLPHLLLLLVLDLLYPEAHSSAVERMPYPQHILQVFVLVAERNHRCVHAGEEHGEGCKLLPLPWDTALVIDRKICVAIFS